MNQRFYGSICVTDLIELAHKKHSAFTKGENGKVYCNVNVWLNENEDKYGNIMSAQCNPTKDKAEQDGQPYIGNFKAAKPKQISDRDTTNMSLPTDIPVAQKQTSDGIQTTEPIDDLPF